ncbi:MAG: DegV family protein [Eubacteriaceae bacterium]|nr:DegV family protein [Eubacteriaceae bacterium]
MVKYIIVAESGADLSPEMIEKYDIRVAQMHVEIDGENYFDNYLPMDKLLGYYERTGKVPKTAGVNPNQYEEIRNRIKEEDPDAVVLFLCYSAKLSVSYQSAVIADDGTLNCHIVDTKNVSVGQAIIVMKTIEMIESQPEIEPEELVSKIEALVEKTRFSFVPGNLDYLRAGGRVSNAQYIGATLLKLTPLIEVIDGFMLSTKKYRGSMTVVVRNMLKEYFDKFPIDKKQTYFVSAGGDFSASIKEEIKKVIEEQGINFAEWMRCGCVITSHSGPGGVGIAGVEV